MSFYHRHVFPRVLDLAMSSRMLVEPRRRTLAPAAGRILEIGFGTGLNLRHYPPGVRRIEALDPDVDLDRFSGPRIRAADIEVDFHHLNAEHLPFDAGSFDTVVCTFTLCSIPDVRHALQEVSRVLRSGGRFLFLEHGLSPSPAVARWQHRLEPLQRRIGGGCHLTRDPVALVRATGLHLEAVSQAYMRATPRFVGYMSEGIALKR